MGRPRDRHSALGLLPRMEAIPRKSGFTYRYHPIGAKPINLGHDKIAACRKVLDLLGKSDDLGTVAWVWQQYQQSKRFLKLSEGTQADYITASKPVLKVFGDVQIGQIQSTMIARYVRVERDNAPRRANIEKTLLSNLFSLGIDLGVCESNPAKLVKPNDEEPRTEAPSTQVLEGFLNWLAVQTPQRRIVGMAARYASLAGSRKVEFLSLTWEQVDLQDMVVLTKRAKQRGKQRDLIVERLAISLPLLELLGELKGLNRECAYVFPTRDNNPYNARAFKTLWQRCVTLAIEQGVLTAHTRFTFHDLRAYYATDHKRRYGALPDLHKNPATTARVYDRSKVVDRSAL